MSIKLKKTDIIKILTLIRVNYDNAYANTSEEEALILVDFWYDSLKDYDYETVFCATKNAIKNCEFIPRIANILSEAQKLTAKSDKSDELLWAELTEVFGRVFDVSRYLAYPQHYNWASERLNKIYAELDDEIKLYVVNVSSLIELSCLTDENLIYERARFFRQMPVLRKRSNDAAQSKQFLELINSKKALTDGSDNK